MDYLPVSVVTYRGRIVKVPMDAVGVTITPYWKGGYVVCWLEPEEF